MQLHFGHHWTIPRYACILSCSGDVCTGVSTDAEVWSTTGSVTGPFPDTHAWSTVLSSVCTGVSTDTELRSPPEVLVNFQTNL